MEFKALDPVEKERTYYYKDGSNITIRNVKRICIRPSGGHRLETTNGLKWIISPGWLAISIIADNWSF